MRFRLHFITIALLASASVVAQPQPDILNEMPLWLSQMKATPSGFMDGIGTGASLHEAFAMALHFLAETSQTHIRDDGNMTSKIISAQTVGPCLIQSLTKNYKNYDATTSFELTLRVTCEVGEDDWNLQTYSVDNPTKGVAVETSRSGSLSTLKLMDAMTDAGTQILWAIVPSKENSMHVIRVRYPVQD